MITFGRLRRHRKVIDEIDLWIELDEVVFVERERRRETENQAEERADHSDHESLREEYPANRLRRHSHRLEDADLLGLVGDDHGERADDVERRHEYDEQQDHTHPELLQLERLEQRVVLLLPIHCAVWPSQCADKARRNRFRLPPIGCLDFDAGDARA